MEHVFRWLNDQIFAAVFKVCPKIRGTLYVFTRQIWDKCRIVIIYLSLEIKLFLSRI